MFVVTNIPDARPSSVGAALNATLASTDYGRYPRKYEPMPLLRSLADRGGGRAAINMALLTELQESETEDPCKEQRVPTHPF